MLRNHDTDRTVAWALRLGAYSSFALLLLGLTLDVVLPEPAAIAVTKAAVIVLLATPVMRIVVSLVSFAREREWKYVLISAGVLAIVVGASLLGAGLH
ncbi:MAG: DUF1634 domain-containing protein [Acidobacteria bacterium]|nr:DUF1634 domain-containing protein [Acidobacteriota bacterium]